jgi:FAD/FMN-containing dehydrogenase
MNDLKSELVARGFSGDLDDTAEALAFYSHDASMFELVPQLVIKPKHTKDVETAVRLVGEHKKTHPDLSLTARSAGTDMSGAAINDSIIVDFNTYFREIISVKDDIAITQPGVFFRDFDVATADYLLPSYPASRDLASVGGC